MTGIRGVAPRFCVVGHQPWQTGRVLPGGDHEAPTMLEERRCVVA
jgi:hypothetical protein